MDTDNNQQITAFRFGVIHDLVGNVELDQGEQDKLLRQKCERKWVIRFSDKARITRSTIMRWVKVYKDSGGKLDSLSNQDRSDSGSTRAVDEESGLALIRLRQEFPKAPVSRIVDEMTKRALVRPGANLNRTTAYRFLFLSGFKGTTLDDLNHCLGLWLGRIYHQRPHSSTGQTPFARFTAKMECLRSAPDNLRDHFRKANNLARGALIAVANDQSMTVTAEHVPLTATEIF